MANVAITMALVDMEHYSAAIEELEQELKEWKRINSSYLEDNRLKRLYQDKAKDVDKANERLDKANEHLKETRIYLLQLKRVANQLNILAEINLSKLSEYIIVAQELSLEDNDVGKLVAVPETIFCTDFRNGVCNGLLI